jgi:hypothetical protein
MCWRLTRSAGTIADALATAPAPAMDSIFVVVSGVKRLRWQFLT